MPSPYTKPLNWVENAIKRDFDVGLRCSSELEYYLQGGEAADDPQNLAQILLKAKRQEIDIRGLDEETGERQYEVMLHFVTSASEDAKRIQTIRDIIKEHYAEKQTNALFEAKPFADQPGCGVHLNLSLTDADDHNLFAKPLDGKEPELLEQVIAGILYAIPGTTYLMVGGSECYQRYRRPKNAEDKANDPMQVHNNSPTHVAWGGNNRTLAIRIPASTAAPELRHIEFRVPSIAADPYAAWFGLLLGTYIGLSHPALPLQDKTFGNAYDPQYDLEPMPRSEKESKAAWKESVLIHETLEKLKIRV